MKSKEEVIKEKWIEIVGAENFNRLTIDKNGYSKSNCLLFISGEKERTLLDNVLNIPKGMPKKYQPNGSDLIYRPKSLANIENNNGWISINSESDLPKTINGGLWEIIRNGEQYFVELLADNPNRLFKDFQKDEVTHYKIHEKSNPPLHK